MTQDAPLRPELTLTPPAAAAVGLAYKGAARILEFGSGGSTVLAGDLGKTITSVECDPAWAAKMRAWFAANPPKGAVTLHEVDIGPVGEWAHPVDETGKDRWADYPSSVWDRPDFQQPDVVLIDGRFRIACLLTVAFRTKAPVTVLFDDYASRPAYHVVEEMFRPIAMHGRLAQFQIDPTPRPDIPDSWITASFERPL